MYVVVESDGIEKIFEPLATKLLQKQASSSLGPLCLYCDLCQQICKCTQCHTQQFVLHNAINNDQSIAYKSFHIIYPVNNCIFITLMESVTWIGKSLM